MNTCEIKLTRGKTALVSSVDIDVLSRHKWHAARCGRGYFYAARKSIDGRCVYMHRQIIDAGPLVVDHINGNTLDNRRENLRAVSAALNAQNITKQPRAKSGSRHVFAQSGGYVARVTREGVTHYLGFYSDANAAAEASEKFIGSSEDPVALATLLTKEALILQLRLRISAIEQEIENAALRRVLIGAAA